MMTRPNRRLLLASALMLTAGTTFAQQAQKQGTPFSQPALDAAQAAGKPIVIEVTAPWCPTCKAQQPIINAVLAKPDMKDITLFRIDFDSQKAALQKLNVRAQSTLIAFKGKTETSRSFGDTTPAGIEKLIRSSL